MEDAEIAKKYDELVDEIVAKYKNCKFTYNLPISIFKGNHTLIGRAGSNLEFKDVRGNSTYMSIDQFLDPGIRLAEDMENPCEIIDINPALASKERKEKQEAYGQISHLADHLFDKQ